MYSDGIDSEYLQKITEKVVSIAHNGWCLKPSLWRSVFPPHLESMSMGTFLDTAVATLDFFREGLDGRSDLFIATAVVAV